MKYRIHLRHTGKDKTSFRISPMWNGWKHGFNIDFGYWFIAVRKKHKDDGKQKFIELKFGKSQQRDLRMRKSSWFKHGQQDAARWILEEWIYKHGLTEENRPFLDIYNLHYLDDRTLPLRLGKIDE